MNPRLKERYSEQVVPALREEHSYKNIMMVPRLEKIVVNVSLKEGITNVKVLEIANFKLREGMPVGTKVTLRGDSMWFFLDRLISVAIPRIRDFRGLNPKAFDGRGNYSLGLTEQIIFPEIDYDKIERITGMNITIVTTAKTDAEGRSLLKHLGMPFRA
jgi:large subunit ribosomal protein L5